MIVKWHHLLRSAGIFARFREIVAAYYGGSFLCYFLPTTLGGDLYRGYRILRDAPDRAGVVASLVMERAIGAFSTISYAWIGLFYLLAHGIATEARPVFLFLFAVSGVALGVFLLSLHPALHRLLLKPFARSRLFRSAEKLSEAYRAFAGRPGALLANLGIAIVETGTQLTVVLGTAWALGLPAHPLTLFAVTAINEFARRTTMVLDGWGLAESLRIVIFGLVGITAADALAIGLVSRAITGIAALPGAFVFFTDPRRGELSRTSKEPSKLARLARRFTVPPLAVSLYYFAKNRTLISMRAEVEASSNLKFGRRCTVSSFVKLKSSNGPLSIGARSGFASGCFVSSGEAGIEIGEHVLCGPNVSIVGSSYRHEELAVPFEDQGHASKGIKIGRNVWIGAGSVIADGAVIGDNTIVVATSLVTRRYPPNVIIQGSPARVIFHRQRTEGGEGACGNGSSTSSGTPSTISTRN
jgi:acetyltransferase-like isoleucine patch superfamily enzyme/uncharacterized membrane protein YbhN (UPF0104 family)